MRRSIITLFITLSLYSCANSQGEYNRRLVGGPCEGCEAVFEFGERKLSSVDTLPGFSEGSTKIKVEGTIYQPDGKTPAENIVLYVYHTNEQGLYSAKKDAKGWGRTHGYHRAWLKTDKNGYYAYYTLKPAPYPNRTEPAHVHYTVLESDGKYYWLGSCHFEGDELLSENEINPDAPRGGTSGLLTLKNKEGLLTGTRDIILGANIPGYQ